MTLPRSFVGVVAAAILVWSDPSASAASCQSPDAGTDRAPILSPPLGKVVIGKGRLQFYSAPSVACRMDGVFVVPRDSLVAYAETRDGWTSVMYGSSGVQGWVRSSRLKTTGTMGLSR